MFKNFTTGSPKKTNLGKIKDDLKLIDSKIKSLMEL